MFFDAAHIFKKNYMPFIMTKRCIEFNKTQYHFCLSPSVINVKSFITINETEGFLGHVLYNSHFTLNHSFISFPRSTQTHRRARVFYSHMHHRKNTTAQCKCDVRAYNFGFGDGLICGCRCGYVCV